MELANIVGKKPGRRHGQGKVTVEHRYTPESAAIRLLRAVILRALADASGADARNPGIGCCNGTETCPISPARCAARWIRSQECRTLCRNTGIPHSELVRLAANPRDARAALNRGRRRYA